jgi:DNA-binding FadR family transcriptional regulator
MPRLTNPGNESLQVQKVSREGLAEQVVEQLQALVVDRYLRSGDRLPGERELCEQFGVSRTVIREATRILAQRGIVAIEPGRGTFVSLPDQRNIALAIELYARARHISLQRVVQVRQVLEPEIARIAAEHATAEQVERLARCIQVMDHSLDDPAAYNAADQEFHSTLAEATGNELFSALTGVIVNLAQKTRRAMFDVSGAPGRGQEYHKLILQRVRERDGAGAGQAMLQHLQQVDRDVAAAEEPPAQASRIAEV